MSEDNVCIRHFDKGVLRHEVTGHNTITDYGRTWLASALALDASGYPLDNRRVVGMTAGIGGKLANLTGHSSAANAAYPAGSDPEHTVGNTYNCKYPVSPVVSTLERPVRFTGSTYPYNIYWDDDVWVSPNFRAAHGAVGATTFRTLIDGSSEITYGSFADGILLSELGLVAAASRAKGIAFMPVVAYFNFPPIPLTATSFTEIYWDMVFRYM